MAKPGLSGFDYYKRKKTKENAQEIEGNKNEQNTNLNQIQSTAEEMKISSNQIDKMIFIHQKTEEKKNKIRVIRNEKNC